LAPKALLVFEPNPMSMLAVVIPLPSSRLRNSKVRNRRPLAVEGIHTRASKP
jgi:hypothetical protein